jgi:mRNA interferase RelE/StbE
VTYEVTTEPAAQRDLRALPRDALRRVDAKILPLAANPRPHGSEKLRGEEALYRLRVGDYRVLYAIDDQKRLVRIVRVRHRREVYRR